VAGCVCVCVRLHEYVYIMYDVYDLITWIYKHMNIYVHTEMCGGSCATLTGAARGRVAAAPSQNAR